MNAIDSIVAGFTRATGPVNAQTVMTTDSDGLEAGEVKIPVADGQIPASRARPATGGPFPTVFVVQEIFGVHEHIKDICRRFAKVGYLAIAPELFARHADMSKVTSLDDARAVAGQVTASPASRRGDARGAREGREARRDRALRRRAARLPCRLPAELSCGAGEGRLAA